MMAVAVAPALDGGAGNKMFIAIDVATSPMEAPSTISGLILTPSVSSSKNLRRPALDAGNGLPFFLPLIAFSLYHVVALLKYVAQRLGIK